MAPIGSGGGGIFGDACGGKAINCYNRGAIGPAAGGIIGSSPGSTNTVTNCYNTGSINASGGGIIGPAAKGTINNCYNAGPGRVGEEIVGANPTINMIIPPTCGSTSSWNDQNACFYLTDYPLTFPGSGTVWTSPAVNQPFVLTQPVTTTTTTTKPTTLTTKPTTKPTTKRKKPKKPKKPTKPKKPKKRTNLHARLLFFATRV